MASVSKTLLVKMKLMRSSLLWIRDGSFAVRDKLQA
jgi:hypothetical protein